MVDGAVKERGTATLAELLALAQRMRADAIAIDNVYELAPSLEELQSLLNSSVHTPRLVQVTAIGDKVYQLSSLAASLGLGGGKLSPEQAAEVCARLCFMGVGSELVLFERGETRVVVSRGRQPVQGGMSAERYRRNIEGRILLKTKEIKNILDSKGIDYDMFISKSAYGIERSVFIVYAPREELFGLVKPVRDHDIQVRVELVEKREPFFAPLASQPRRARSEPEYLIVGIDPGVTTGVAALTLNGELKALFSAKELGRGQVARILLEMGTPVIVATDASPPPEYVKKLAAMLDAALVAPQKPLTVEEKRRLVSEYVSSSVQQLKVRDAHQRDALAAALNAYSQLQPKLAETRERVRRLGLSIPLEEVEALVAKGFAIWDAIRQVSRACLVPEREQRIPRPTDRASSAFVESLIDKLNDAYTRIQKLEFEREKLLEKIKILEDQYEKLLNAQAYEVRKEKEIESLKIKIDMILKENNMLKEYIKRKEDELSVMEDVMLKVAAGEAILALRFSTLDRALSVPHASGVAVVGTLRPEDLKNFLEIRSKNKVNLKAIICEQDFPDSFAIELASFDIALLSLSEVRPLARVKDVYVFKREDIEWAISEKLKRLEEAAKDRVKIIVKNVLEDYRCDRRRLAKSYDRTV